MKKQSIKKGIYIMSVANFINKGMGAAYILLLVPLLTNKGIAILNNAQYIYNIFIVAFTSGFSTALAKIFSENLSLGRYKYVRDAFKASFLVFSIISILSAVIMYMASAYLVIDKHALYSIFALMPALFFTAIITVFKGYLQGMRYMLPIALAQTIEQIVNISVSIFLVTRFMPNLYLAAFGAALGTSAGALSSLTVYTIAYLRTRHSFPQGRKGEASNHEKHSVMSIMKHTLSYAVPICVGGTIIQGIGIADLFVFNKIFPLIGLGAEQIKELYGIYSAQVVKLIDIPAVFTLAICANMLPAIASSFAGKNMGDVRQKTNGAYRFTTLIAVPSAVGLSVLAGPIIKLAFGRQGSFGFGGYALGILAYAIIFISLIQVSTSILQGVSRIYKPIKNILIGFGVKLLVCCLLFFIPQYRVETYAISIITLGTVLCYMTAALLDIIDVKKYIGIKNELFVHQLKAFLSALVMALFVVLAYNKMMYVSHSNLISITISILTGVVVYGISLLLIGGIKSQDLQIIGLKQNGRKTNE